MLTVLYICRTQINCFNYTGTMEYINILLKELFQKLQHRRVIAVCLICALTIQAKFVWAQKTVPAIRPDSVFCGTPSLTPQQRQALEAQIQLALLVKQASGTDKAGGITYVPIRPHVFRTATGTGGMSLNSLNNVLAITNQFYYNNGSGIQFYFCGTSPDYIDRDTEYNAFPFQQELSVSGRDATNAMNVYFVNQFDIAGLLGYAYFPTSSLQSTRSFIRTNGLSDTYIGSYVLNHELGHNFNLYHTFEGNTPFATAELATRGTGANCSGASDLLCDTPADPYGRDNATTEIRNGCETYVGTITDEQGNAYTPQTNNIMSYYDGCSPTFTAGQHNRMQGGLAFRQNTGQYNLSCTPTAVTAVTGVAATPVTTGGIRISWQDNATNEMGYFVERADSPTGPFVPVGGVGPNTSSFIDLTPTTYRTYTYRVRPSNTTTGAISNMVTVTSGITYCQPLFTIGCVDQDGLNSLTVNGVTISQDSGCATTGYTQSTVVSTTLAVGQAVSVGGRFLGSTYPEGATIWGDLNRNGAFEPDEMLYETPITLTSGFWGTITIPPSTPIGPMTVRVLVQFNGMPTSGCGVYKFGEAEDYVIHIAPACTSMASIREGNWTDPTVWSCYRVPVATDAIEVRHVVTVPPDTTVSAKRVTYTATGEVDVKAGGRLRLGF